MSRGRNENPLIKFLVFSISLSLIILIALYTTTVYFIAENPLFMNLLIYLTMIGSGLLVYSQVKNVISYDEVKRFVRG